MLRYCGSHWGCGKSAAALGFLWGDGILCGDRFDGVSLLHWVGFGVMDFGISTFSGRSNRKIGLRVRLLEISLLY